MKAPTGDNRNRKIRLMRIGRSAATERYSIGGLLKKGRHAPKPISLPVVKFTEPKHG